MLTVAACVAALRAAPPAAATTPAIPVYVFAGQSNMAAYGFRPGPDVSAIGALSRTGTVEAVTLAVNGSSLASDWNPASPDGLARTLERKVQASLRRLGSRAYVAAFFWMQGETDSDDAQSAAAYGKNLTALINRWRAVLGDAPFVLGQIGHAGPYTARVRAEQLRVAASVERTILIRTDDLDRAPGDPLHFSTKGTRNLGYRFAGAVM